MAQGLSIEQAVRRRRILAIVGASSGNLVEWFDFYVYAFTALYFASAFFPRGDQTSQLLNTTGVFAVGFLVRPLGGWFFGRLADTRGRRTSMLISVFMMCGGSLMVAVLPTFNSVGVIAPILLLVARLIQGLSVGGEYGAAATYMSEVAVSKHRGFYASFQYVTLIGGQLLAVLVLVILQHSLSAQQLTAWGWRIPFVIGAAAAILAFVVRSSLDETAPAEVRQRLDAGSLRVVLARHPRAFFVALGLTSGGAVLFYTYTTYMQKFLVNTAGLRASVASAVMTLVLFCFMIVQPVFGALSDRIGRRNSMRCFAVLAAVTTVPLLSNLSVVKGPVPAFFMVLSGLLIISLYSSVAGLVKAELFPTELRATGVGITHAIGSALFGGSAEYLALWLKSIGRESLFSWYITVLCGLVLISSMLMPAPAQFEEMRGRLGDA